MFFEVGGREQRRRNKHPLIVSKREPSLLERDVVQSARK
jgi:hypothetical protein